MDAELVRDLVLTLPTRLEQADRLPLELLAVLPPGHGTSLVWQLPVVSGCPQKTGNPITPIGERVVTWSAQERPLTIDAVDGESEATPHPPAQSIAGPEARGLMFLEELAQWA